jgi:4a-hydroxytetrahydrobiopterin dehydratase
MGSDSDARRTVPYGPGPAAPGLRCIGRTGTPRTMDRMDPSAIVRALADLDGWRHVEDALVRDLEFDSFLSAIAFIDRVAVLAEQADHHPELRNVHRQVEVRLRTHEAGGITSRDIDLARAIDDVVRTEG